MKWPSDMASTFVVRGERQSIGGAFRSQATSPNQASHGSDGLETVAAQDLHDTIAVWFAVAIGQFRFMNATGDQERVDAGARRT